MTLLGVSLDMMVDRMVDAKFLVSRYRVIANMIAS